MGTIKHKSTNWFLSASWSVSPISWRRYRWQSTRREERSQINNNNKKKDTKTKQVTRKRERNCTFSSRSLFHFNLLFIVSNVKARVNVYAAAGYNFSDLVTFNNEPMRYEKVRPCNCIYGIFNLLFYCFFLFSFFGSFYQSIKFNLKDETWRYEKSSRESAGLDICHRSCSFSYSQTPHQVLICVFFFYYFLRHRFFHQRFSTFNSGFTWKIDFESHLVFFFLFIIH